MTGISDKHEVILINLFQKVLTKNYSSVLEKSRDKITHTKTGNTTSLVPLVGGLLNFSVSIFSRVNGSRTVSVLPPLPGKQTGPSISGHFHRENSLLIFAGKLTNYSGYDINKKSRTEFLTKFQIFLNIFSFLFTMLCTI